MSSARYNLPPASRMPGAFNRSVSIWNIKVVIFLCMISVFILPTILLYPFNVDNDLYQCMGIDLSAHFGLPYLQSWDHNFPGVVVLHALSIAMFGSSMIGFRFLEFLIQVLTLIALYRVSRLWISNSAPLTTASPKFVVTPNPHLSDADC